MGHIDGLWVVSGIFVHVQTPCPLRGFGTDCHPGGRAGLSASGTLDWRAT